VIEPYVIDVPDAALEDLSRRLRAARWPDAETAAGWSQGVPLTVLQELCGYWADGYDWRRCERELDALGQYRTEIAGLGIHFLHVRSRHPGATPLLLTHGWPGSILEFRKAIPALVDPTAHGGRADDAFHVVCPSLPGFGFSDRPTEAGWGVARIADAWATLMDRLGYERFGAQGGDWGAMVTTRLAQRHPGRLVGIHLNWAILSAAGLRDQGTPTSEEVEALAALRRLLDHEWGYALQQRTRPQTLGYGLADSPAGQCAWILEKLVRWSDCGDDFTRAYTRDEILDGVTLYWLRNTGASSARLYWESLATELADATSVLVPAAYSAFPREFACFSERWVASRYRDLRHYRRLERGGHFAAMEQPAAFVDELRHAFRAMR
jgi:pimeloyl-ACP methyl ester carboxylesterase